MILVFLDFWNILKLKNSSLDLLYLILNVIESHLHSSIQWSVDGQPENFVVQSLLKTLIVNLSLVLILSERHREIIVGI